MRVAIYRRVSTTRQATSGASLEEQLAACQAYALTRGWAVVADFAEAGRSAYSEELRRRPQFQAMIAAAGRREFDVVIVYELSRFARRQRVQFGVGADLEKLGVKLVSASEQFDQGTVEGFVIYSVLAMQAELHSRLLSRRIKAVRAHEVSQGRIAMRAPRGMQWGENGLEPAENPALVRRAFELALEGVSAQGMLPTLLGEGHNINLSSLHYLLRNPVYAGLLRHKGQLFPAAWPAIISREQWERVQEIRAGKRAENPVRSTVRSHNETLLAGLAHCANCGAKLHYEHHPEGRCYYRCSCRQNGGHCDARPSRADALDAQLTELVSALVLPPDAVERARAYVEARLQQCPKVVSDDGAAIKEALRRLSRAYADGGLTDSEYDQRRAALLARQEAAQATQAAEAPALDPAVALALIGQLQELWQGASTPERRGILGQLVSQVYARRHTVYAVRPTRIAAPALVVIWGQNRATFSSSSQAAHSAISSIALLAA